MGNHILNGYIYENGEAQEINFLTGNTVTIQAIGTGTYELFGKMRGGAYTEISLINSEFELVDKGENQNLYTADVDGLSYITVKNVEGNIEKIFFDISTGDKISVNKSGGGSSITVDDFLSLSSTNPVQNKVITAALNEKADKQEIQTEIQADVQTAVEEAVPIAVEQAIEDNIATTSEVDEVIEELEDL